MSVNDRHGGGGGGMRGGGDASDDRTHLITSSFASSSSSSSSPPFTSGAAGAAAAGGGGEGGDGGGGGAPTHHLPYNTDSSHLVRLAAGRSRQQKVQMEQNQRYYQRQAQQQPQQQQQQQQQQHNRMQPKAGAGAGTLRSRRVLDRSGPFFQSRGKWNIKRKISYADWTLLYGYDWFHTVVNAPTYRILLLLFLMYVLIMALFAVPYMLIARYMQCRMDCYSFLEAYFFSLETMTTIGFGTEDYFFGECWTPAVIITIQVVVSLVADAVCLGVLFERISRGQRRASTVIFSDKAVIRRIRGRLYFMFQVCELRKHQLVEAHVRCYALRHDRDANGDVLSNFQSYYMRLVHPDDEIGGMLLMTLPSMVVHEINTRSPIYPPPQWASRSGLVTWKAPASAYRPTHYPFEELAELDDDAFPFADSGSGVGGPDGGEEAEDDETELVEEEDEDEESALMAGPETKVIAEKDEDLEAGPQHSRAGVGVNGSKHRKRGGPARTVLRRERAMLQKYMADRHIEIVVLVEGIDSLTSSTLQARHSYCSEDLVWDHSFEPCVVENPESGGCVVDFSRFHELRQAPENAAFSGLVNP